MKHQLALARLKRGIKRIKERNKAEYNFLFESNQKEFKQSSSQPKMIYSNDNNRIKYQKKINSSFNNNPLNLKLRYKKEFPFFKKKINNHSYFKSNSTNNMKRKNYYGLNITHDYISKGFNEVNESYDESQKKEYSSEYDFKSEYVFDLEKYKINEKNNFALLGPIKNNNQSVNILKENLYKNISTPNMRRSTYLNLEKFKINNTNNNRKEYQENKFYNMENNSIEVQNESIDNLSINTSSPRKNFIVKTNQNKNSSILNNYKKESRRMIIEYLKILKSFNIKTNIDTLLSSNNISNEVLQLEHKSSSLMLSNQITRNKSNSNNSLFFSKLQSAAFLFFPPSVISNIDNQNSLNEKVNVTNFLATPRVLNIFNPSNGERNPYIFSLSPSDFTFLYGIERYIFKWANIKDGKIVGHFALMESLSCCLYENNSKVFIITQEKQKEKKKVSFNIFNKKDDDVYLRLFIEAPSDDICDSYIKCFNNLFFLVKKRA